MKHTATTNPGAMTRSMTAAQGAAGPKALRIGLMRGTAMLHERVLRERGAVRVGTSERDTLTVPAGDVAASVEVFAKAPGGWALRFDATMEGEVALPSGLRRLRDLRDDPSVPRDGATWCLALPETARGRVRFGALTLLFQFVAAPTAMPRPQLPTALRTSWARGTDWTYNGCLSAFLVLAVAGVGWTEFAWDPLVDADVLDDPRFVRLLAMPPDTSEPAEPAHDAEGAAADAPRASNAATPPARSSRPSRPSSMPGPDRSVDRAEAAAAAATRAVDSAMHGLDHSADLALLTGVNGTTGRSARDALAEGGLMTGTEADLAHVGGIAENDGRVGVHRGTMASAAAMAPGHLGVHDTVASTGDHVGERPVELRVRIVHPTTDLGAPDVHDEDGTVDANAVARIIRGQLGGVRDCYQRELRNNPALQGRLEVSFTLGTSGRITHASTNGMSEAPAVGTCVTARLRGLVFPMPEGGSVGFSFPFTFAPGG